MHSRNHPLEDSLELEIIDQNTNAALELIRLILPHKKATLKSFNDKNQSFPHLAYRENNAEVIQELSKFFTKEDWETFLFQRDNGGYSCIDYALQSGNDISALEILDLVDSQEEGKPGYQYHLTANEEGNTLLHYAVKYQRKRIIEILLEKIHQQTHSLHFINRQNKTGEAPIFWAVQSKNQASDIMLLLIDHGARLFFPNTQNQLSVDIFNTWSPLNQIHVFSSLNLKLQKAILDHYTHAQEPLILQKFSRLQNNLVFFHLLSYYPPAGCPLLGMPMDIIRYISFLSYMELLTSVETISEKEFLRQKAIYMGVKFPKDKIYSEPLVDKFNLLTCSDASSQDDAYHGENEQILSMLDTDHQLVASYLERLEKFSLLFANIPECTVTGKRITTMLLAAGLLISMLLLSLVSFLAYVFKLFQQPFLICLIHALSIAILCASTLNFGIEFLRLYCLGPPSSSSWLYKMHSFFSKVALPSNYRELVESLKDEIWKKLDFLKEVDNGKYLFTSIYNVNNLGQALQEMLLQGEKQTFPDMDKDAKNLILILKSIQQDMMNSVTPKSFSYFYEMKKSDNTIDFNEDDEEDRFLLQ